MSFFKKKEKEETDLIDTIDAMHIQRVFQELTILWQNEAHRHHLIARLIENGNLTPEGQITEADRKPAIAIYAKCQQAESEQRRKRQEEQKAHDETYNSPEQKYPRLFLRRNGDPTSLLNWLNTTPFKDLQILHKQLVDRPNFWNSLYPAGHFTDAVTTLESAITKRTRGEAIGTLVSAAESVIQAENAKRTD